MRHADLSLPEIGVLGATRGMLGAGLGLLLAARLPDRRRKLIGWPLLAIGAVSTVPLAIDIVKKSKRT